MSSCAIDLVPLKFMGTNERTLKYIWNIRIHLYHIEIHCDGGDTLYRKYYGSSYLLSNHSAPSDLFKNHILRSVP